MTIIHNDTEFADSDMWEDERENPLLLGLYAAVIVATLAGSVLWPYWITP
jgi:hypothetical protein